MHNELLTEALGKNDPASSTPGVGRKNGGDEVLQHRAGVSGVRYQRDVSPKLDDENEQIADLLLGLTKAKCQSASNFNPQSAFKVDPLMLDGSWRDAV